MTFVLLQARGSRKEGKHTLLFRVKSNAGTRFVALPLGKARQVKWAIRQHRSPPLVESDEGRSLRSAAKQLRV
jgi:hypothetical protein